MIESLFRSASGARTGAPPAFSLVSGVFAPRYRLELFSLRICHVIDRQVSAFRLVFVLFLFFSPSLRHAGLVQVIRNLFFALFPARAIPGRPLPRFGLAVLRTSYPGRMRGSRSFFSVFYPLFLVPEPVSFTSSAVVVPRLSFAPFPAGSVPAFGTPCHPLPVRGNEILSGFGAVRLDWQRRASYPAVQVCRVSARCRPAPLARLCVGPAFPCPLAYGLEQHDGRSGRHVQRLDAAANRYG